VNLLVDIGNSRLKWATSGPGGLAAGSALANATLTEASLAEVWRGIPPPERLAIFKKDRRVKARNGKE